MNFMRGKVTINKEDRILNFLFDTGLKYAEFIITHFCGCLQKKEIQIEENNFHTLYILKCQLQNFEFE